MRFRLHLETVGNGDSRADYRGKRNHRQNAVRSWEVSFTNEFLTQMEQFRGILICTTNRMSELDAASIRRFNRKIRFDHLTPQGVVTFYEKLLGGPGWVSPRRARGSRSATHDQSDAGGFQDCARPVRLSANRNAKSQHAGGGNCRGVQAEGRSD